MTGQIQQDLVAFKELGYISDFPGGPVVKTALPHSSILAWKIPWMEEPGGLQVQGVAKSRTRLKRHSNYITTTLLSLLLLSRLSRVWLCATP